MSTKESLIAYYRHLCDQGEFDDRAAAVAREDAEDLVAAVRKAVCGELDQLDAWWEKATEQVARQMVQEKEGL